MKRNISNPDKVIRVILAILIGVLYFTGQVSGTLGIILLIVAVVFLLTSFIGTCPIYLGLGLSTRKE